MTYRSWCYTLNNPLEEDTESIHGFARIYRRGIVQLERGTGSTLHLQGYLEARTPIRISSLRLLFGGRAHWERRRGTARSAWDYCKKDQHLQDGDNSFIHSFGTEPGPGGPGRRSDLYDLNQAIQGGSSLRGLREDFGEQIIKYSKGIRTLIDLHSEARDRSTGKMVFCFWGDTETGKTRTAWELYPDLYDLPIQQGRSMWFNGYEGEKVVLFDEFEGEMPLTSLLRILDRYALKVPTKGGYVQLVADIIIVTSNSHPREWYTWEGRENKEAALMRRFTGGIRKFVVPGTGIEE